MEDQLQEMSVRVGSLIRDDDDDDDDDDDWPAAVSEW
jgi:hypothetical protein